MFLLSKHDTGIAAVDVLDDAFDGRMTGCQLLYKRFASGKAFFASNQRNQYLTGMYAIAYDGMS